MPAPPLVTVITATYNGAATLRSTLSSLCGQEFTDFEAWIVGDASTDDSDAVVASMRDTRLHWTNLATNSGSQSAANNEGLRRARGTYVAYLGHDDLWFPWHLATLVRTLEAGDADLAHSLVALVDPAGTAGVIGEPPDGVARRHHFIPPSSWLHRRAAAGHIGEWTSPGSASCGVDLDYARRMLAAGCRFTFAPRLSVLKFPSAWFRSYAPDGSRPQASFLARMQADACSLEHDVLTDLARLLARDQATPGSRPGSDLAYLRQALRVVAKRRVRDRLDRWWPMQRFEHWRFQRARQQARLTRGLTP